MRARHRVSKLLLRQGIVYTGAGTTWRPAHHAWLQMMRFDDVALQVAYDCAYEAVILAEGRRSRLDQTIATMAADSPWSAMVARLRCLRGIDTLTAFALAVEIGDWERFTGSNGRFAMASLHELVKRGQSPWIHGLSCLMLDDGSWPSLIEKGIRGATMGPAELGRAVVDGRCYDEQLRRMSADIEDREAYNRLLTADAQRACDALAVCALPGSERDGWVSAAIDPDTAHDAAATVAEAVWLHEVVSRPNFMVQIPATDEGLSAIEECTARGLSVDATLLYSRSRHQQAANAYLDGLTRFVQAGGEPWLWRTRSSLIGGRRRCSRAAGGRNSLRRALHLSVVGGRPAHRAASTSSTCGI
jgi:hypothetical protein